jgi:hypothetical protein
VLRTGMDSSNGNECFTLEWILRMELFKMREIKTIPTVPAQSAKFQPKAPFHPDQVEGFLPIPLGFKQFQPKACLQSIMSSALHAKACLLVSLSPSFLVFKGLRVSQSLCLQRSPFPRFSRSPLFFCGLCGCKSVL